MAQGCRHRSRAPRARAARARRRARRDRPLRAHLAAPAIWRRASRSRSRWCVAMRGWHARIKGRARRRAAASARPAALTLAFCSRRERGRRVTRVPHAAARTALARDTAVRRRLRPPPLHPPDVPDHDTTPPPSSAPAAARERTLLGARLTLSVRATAADRPRLGLASPAYLAIDDPTHLRLQVLSPFGVTVLDLATAGDTFTLALADAERAQGRGVSTSPALAAGHHAPKTSA